MKVSAGWYLQKTFCIVSIFVCVTIAGFSQSFSGRIRYANSFKNAQNRDVEDSITRLLGQQTRYFVNDGSVKAYNEKEQLLFNSVTKYNLLFPGPANNNSFVLPSLAQPLPDSSIIVKKLPGKKSICNRECISLQLSSNQMSAVYFFDPTLLASPDLFKEVRFANWNKLLSVTNGALPLECIYTDKSSNITWTSTAVEAQPMQLAARDFLDGSDFSSPPPGWVYFSTDEWRAYFPKRPLERTYVHSSAVGYVNVKATELSMPVSDSSNILSYAVFETELPDSLVSSTRKEWVETYLRAVLAFTVDKVNGKLVSESHIQLFGYPGIEIKVSYSNNQLLLHERLYLVNARLYTVAVTSSAENSSGTDADIFLNFFALPALR